MTTLFFLIVSIIALIVLWKFHTNQVDNYQNEIYSLKEHHFNYYPNEWIQKLETRIYENEVEVEIKFVLPLMMYLGYSLDQMRIRVPATIPAGTQIIEGKADWVIAQKSDYGDRNILIEVKSSNITLNDAVIQQARSYAFALNISKYVITNGRQIVVFERGVEWDREVLNLLVTDFGIKWNSLKENLGSK